MTKKNPIFDSHKLKLGVFCINTMPALTRAKDLFQPTWEECLTIGRMADAAGFDALVPIARWKGYVDDDFNHPSNNALEPFTFAAAMAQATSRIAVFATTHAPIVHPLVIAKQAATVDVISGGRFAMNVVGGWNRREFDMFGLELMTHEDRYAYLAEWLGLIRDLWSAESEINVDSRFFKMNKALVLPHPLQGGRVPIMNAGFSEAGKRFAAANSDVGLIGLFGEDVASWAEQIGNYKKLAREEFGKTIQVWTNAQLILRDTDKEAEALFHYYTHEAADEAAVEGYVSTLARENKIPAGSEQLKFLRRTAVAGSGFPLYGSAETIGAKLESLSRAGLDGVIFSCVDFVDSLHRFNRDVLPLLFEVGIREAR